MAQRSIKWWEIKALEMTIKRDKPEESVSCGATINLAEAEWQGSLPNTTTEYGMMP